MPVNPQSNYIDLISNGFAVSIGSAVVGYVTALLLIGIAKLLGFAEIKAGVREVGAPAPEPAKENPIVVDEREPQGNPEGGSTIDSSGFFWSLLRYISFIVFFIFLAIFGLSGLKPELSFFYDYSYDNRNFHGKIMLFGICAVIYNIYRLLAHIISWLRSL